MSASGATATIGAVFALALATPRGDARAQRAVQEEGAAEARAFWYVDGEGLQVVTAGAQIALPLPWGDAVVAEALVDDISIDPDAVSSASIHLDSTGEGGGLDEQRYEVGAGYVAALGSSTRPVQLAATGRVSTEPDYFSWSVQLAATTELFARNTAVGVFGGYGNDRIEPTSFAPDDQGRWPATHDRWLGGVSVRQLVTPRIDVSGALAITRQHGALSSPYRRPLVLSGVGLFRDYRPEAERHPAMRTRYTGLLATSVYLGGGVAAHTRVSGHVDSWGITALAPETALTAELGAPVIASVGYRWYGQRAADFYATRYDELRSPRTGDRRLGAITENAARADVRWTVRGRAGAAGALELIAAYELSHLRYRDLEGGAVIAHVTSLGSRLPF